MKCKSCNTEFENRSLMMKHIKAGHDPVPEPQQPVPIEAPAEPLPPTDSPTVETVQKTQEEMVQAVKTHFDALMDAFQEVRDADARAGLMTVLQDLSINQESPQAVFQKVFKVVSDGDARMVVRTHLRLL